MSGALWTAEEIATATGGHAHGTWSVAGVSIDTRTIQPADLFVALRGPSHDGHEFVRDAIRRGGAAMVDRVPDGLPERSPLVVVGDTLEGLTTLGVAARSRSHAKTIGITGSVGKTGTKEALRMALAGQAATHASASSFNNHWGVPLSLARQPKDAAYAVYELGMNAPGEIDRLTRLVRPHVALVTAIEAAHLGFFPSIEAIADAKAEIFHGLEPGGTAILNADNPHTSRLRAHAEAAGAARIITFGQAAGADARLLAASLEVDGSEVEMALGQRHISFRLGAPGRHWVQNALAVVAAAEALGADPEAAAAALAGFRPPKGRGVQHDLPWQGGRIHLMDESYNANPASVRAAISVLGTASGRRVAVLGDMLELGAEGEALHRGLVEAIEAAGIERVHTVGPLMTALREALPPARRGIHAGRAKDLEEPLLEDLQPGDTVLVKGSLGSRMGPLVEALLAAAGASAPARAGG